MLKIEKILFPTDFSSCADRALDYALVFARRYGAQLHMLHAVVLHEDDPRNPDQRFPDFTEIHQRLAEIAGDRMDATIESRQTEGLQIVKAQERGVAAAPVILQYAADNDIDLIVMGTHGRRGLEHLLLGSVAEEVVRRAPCPVMTVRETRGGPESVELREILVPVDFSKYSKAALQAAAELAEQFGAKLTLLHVVEESIHPAFYVTGKESVMELNPEIEDKSKEAMTRLLSEMGKSHVGFETEVVAGRPANEIIKFAESHGTDLIVTGTHGLSGLERFLLGSTTEKVVRHVDCPVLTVKLPKEES